LPRPFFFTEIEKNRQRDTWYTGIAAVREFQAPRPMLDFRARMLAVFAEMRKCQQVQAVQ